MTLLPLVPRTRRPRLEDVRARDLMTPNPVSIRHGVTIREAGVFLEERGVGAVPVMNDAGRAIGVLSRSDVLMAVSVGLESAPVREVMTPAVIAVRLDATAMEVAEALTHQMVQRVFVVDGDGIPLGVVTTGDLLQGLVAAWATPATPPDDRAGF